MKLKKFVLPAIGLVLALGLCAASFRGQVQGKDDPKNTPGATRTTPGLYHHFLGNGECQERYFNNGQKPNPEWSEGPCPAPSATQQPPTSPSPAPTNTLTPVPVVTVIKASPTATTVIVTASPTHPGPTATPTYTRPAATPTQVGTKSPTLTATATSFAPTPGSTQQITTTVAPTSTTQCPSCCTCCCQQQISIPYTITTSTNITNVESSIEYFIAAGFEKQIRITILPGDDPKPSWVADFLTWINKKHPELKDCTSY